MRCCVVTSSSATNVKLFHKIPDMWLPLNKQLLLLLIRWFKWRRAHLPMQDAQAPSLRQEDLLEEGTAAHSSILAEKPHGQRLLWATGQGATDTTEHAGMITLTSPIAAKALTQFYHLFWGTLKLVL